MKMGRERRGKRQKNKGCEEPEVNDFFFLLKWNLKKKKKKRKRKKSLC